jgi:hypothetical protein
MDACLQSQTVLVNMQEYYDLRYFYVDQDSIGRFTCGIAFETMMSIYRQHRLIQFCGQEWYSAVRLSENLVVQGFLAEHICLSHIASNGLIAVNPSLGRMSHTSFKTKPDWDHQLSAGHTIRLYIPTAYNFKAVDAVILFVDYETAKVHMYLIQITLIMQHKPSEKAFYRGMCEDWVRSLKEAGYTVESTFVWIDKKQPVNRIKPQPRYLSMHIGIADVDPRLAATLSL